MTDLFTFVHLTDLHIGNPDIVDDHLFSDTTANLKALLADIKTLVPQPKFIVATGDLTNQGDEGSYRNLKAILDDAALEIPMFFALGNHDKRDGFYTGMLGRNEDLGAPFFHAQAIDGVHLITLDSSTPGKVGGSIEPEQFAWLEAELDAHPDLPSSVICSPAAISWASFRATSISTAFPTGTASPLSSASAPTPQPTSPISMKACAWSKALRSRLALSAPRA